MKVLGNNHFALQIYAIEGRFASGKSFARALFGASSLANWKFVARISGDLVSLISNFTDDPDDVFYNIDFQLNYGQSIEFLSGLDRQYAQSALKVLHEEILADGWRPMPSGPYWYSYRYWATREEIERMAERH